MLIKQKGIIWAVLAAVISGFAVFINKFGVSSWQDAIQYTTVKNFVAMLVLSTVLLTIAQWRALKKMTQKQWLKLGVIGVIGGSVPFILFFKSLPLMPATQAAFIHKTLFVWVAVMAVIWLKERVGLAQWGGMAVLMIGVVMLGGPKDWIWGIGFLLALIATVLWALETVIAKTVLQDIPALVGAWARMAFGSVILIVYVLAQGKAQGLIPQSSAQVGWALITGLILFGYVICWYTALKKLPITLVSTVLVFAFPITVVLDKAWTHTLSGRIVLPLAVMAIGGLFFCIQNMAFLVTHLQRRGM